MRGGCEEFAVFVHYIVSHFKCQFLKSRDAPECCERSGVVLIVKPHSREKSWTSYIYFYLTRILFINAGT